MILKTKPSKRLGFTVVELLIVMTVIGILAAIVSLSIPNWKNKSNFSRTTVELTIMANALKLYANETNTFPPDAPDAGIPSEIKKYIDAQHYDDNWPDGPWNGSMYDYDAWDVDGDGKNETFQTSLRFCTWPERASPGGQELCANRAPTEYYEWAKDFDSNNNSIYYCVKGYCRSNGPAPYTTPGYCINCPENKAIKMPSES